MLRIAVLMTILVLAWAHPVHAQSTDCCGDCDADGDGLCLPIDNCLEHANPDQTDTDGDYCGNACDADYDNDGVVGFPDFGAFVAAFGTTDEEKKHVDPIVGGTVGYPDFGFFTASFGSVPGPSGISTGTLACP